MSKYQFFIALVASALLAGCAGAPKMHAHNPDQSEAWNLAWPADIKIRDAKVPKSGPIAPERGIAGAATVGTLSYLSPPPGFSSGFGAGLSALAWLSEQERVSQRSRIVAWVPKSQADSSDAAAKLFYDLATAALQESIEEHGLPEPYALTGFEERGGISSRYFTYYGVLTGDECSGRLASNLDDKVLVCALGFSVSGRTNGIPGQNTLEDIAPEQMGGYPAWRVTATIHRGYTDMRDGPARWLPRLPEVEIFSKVSKKLPEWAYIYIAPGFSSIKNDEGNFRFLMFPLIIHQGEPLYFIRPES